MTAALSAETIARAFTAACEAELASLKPGNVHVHADGHRMDAAMFRASAAAAAPHISASGARVGARIEAAVAATLKAVGCNTNLGIILLCAPLAAAAERDGGPLRLRLDAVLDDLDVADAQAAFRAIAAANPAGLGNAPSGDVAKPTTLTLYQAMELARDRDRIALAYVTDFADVCDFALPVLSTALLSAASPELAVTTLHMTLLATFPDTHITRKHGQAAARDVQQEAARLRPTFQPVATAAAIPDLLALDASLKARNPARPPTSLLPLCSQTGCLLRNGR
jgi:triphosphoribosyl-dephospho-CoA synthase